MSLAYLAAPYSHPNPQIKDWRYKAVTKVAAELLKEKQMVYSPLTHNVPLSRLGVVGSWETWRELDHHMLSKCDLLIVLTLEGWETSTGVLSEIEFAKEKNIPIHYKEFTHEVQDFDQTTMSALLQKMIAAYAERDWNKFHSPKNLSMTLSVEASEIMEHFMWASQEESYLKDPKKLQAVKQEIGDVMLVLMHLSHTLGIDPVQAATEKLEEICKKYPVEKCKGLSHKYTEYADSH